MTMRMWKWVGLVALPIAVGACGHVDKFSKKVEGINSGIEQINLGVEEVNQALQGTPNAAEALAEPEEASEAGDGMEAGDDGAEAGDGMEPEDDGAEAGPVRRRGPRSAPNSHQRGGHRDGGGAQPGGKR